VLSELPKSLVVVGMMMVMIMMMIRINIMKCEELNAKP
jgi:hypothetical protein